MVYIWITLLSMIGPYFWPLNNGVVFTAALVTQVADPYGTALAIGLGSTISFLGWYSFGRYSRKISTRWREKMNRIRLDRFRGSTSAVTFSGAAMSIPPLTPVALFLGSTRSSFPRFAFFTLLGRILRFVFAVWMLDQVIGFFSKSKYYELVKNWLEQL